MHPDFYKMFEVLPLSKETLKSILMIRRRRRKPLIRKVFHQAFISKLLKSWD
jgi:hypothetical protein